MNGKLAKAIRAAAREQTTDHTHGYTSEDPVTRKWLESRSRFSFIGRFWHPYTITHKPGTYRSNLQSLKKLINKYKRRGIPLNLNPTLECRD